MTNFKIRMMFYPVNNSMLKKTYSPLSIIFKSSAASIISLIVFGLAHIITTEMKFNLLNLSQKIL